MKLFTLTTWHSSQQHVFARFQQHSDKEVLAAAKFSGVHELVTSLPEGYDTILDLNASALSTGQKQLIGFARAVFRNPSIVLLDEPNAHLDIEGNKIFEKLLYRLKECQITSVIISHRSNVIDHVDYYLEIKYGQTAIFAPTAELRKANNLNQAKQSV